MRVEGWEQLLRDHLNDARPFAWGSRDCALWAAEWVRKCTGNDFGAEWRGRYSTAAGAAKTMFVRGFPNVAAIAAAHLTEIPVSLAARGDIVLHPVDGCLGVCDGRQSHFLTEHDSTAVPTLACPRAWKVD